mgnify:CR=1
MPYEREKPSKQCKTALRIGHLKCMQDKRRGDFRKLVNVEWSSQVCDTAALILATALVWAIRDMSE